MSVYNGKGTADVQFVLCSVTGMHSMAHHGP